LLIEKESEDRYKKMPTAKGDEFGIKIVDKVSEKGNAYSILMYPVKVQRMLVEHFIDESIEEESNLDDKIESSWLAKKREKNAGAYMPWTEEEDKKLVNEFNSEQFSIRDLSEIHGRTTGAIRARIKKLGLINEW